MMRKTVQTTAPADRPSAFGSRRNCPHTGEPCLQGEALCTWLCASVGLARPLLGPDFSLQGEVQVTSCHRPCRLVFLSTMQAAWCFGDVPEDADPDRLLDGVDGAVAHAGAVSVAHPPAGPWQ